MAQIKTNQYSIADDAITLAKMAGGTDGNILTYDASGNPAVVASGTSGHFLKSQGADTVPLFAAGGVNTPFFYAYRATNWDLVNATLSTVPHDTVLYQTGSTYNTSTYAWTPAEAGTYKFYATIRSSSGSFGNYEMYIKTSVAGEVARTQGAMNITTNVSVIRTLTSSENVFITMYQDSGSTKTFTGGSIYTFFCGFKLIGA